MPIIAAFTVGATSAQVQAWFLVAIASSLLHSTGAQQEMLFVVDRWNHRIMSWEVGGNAGKAVAGSASGGMYGQSLKLLSNPGGVDIANNGETIFVSDTDNHRIVRWREGDTEGEVVAGGNGKGSEPNQLNFPYGIVAGLGGASIFVVDSENARVVVWFVGGKEASVIVAGGNGKGAKENQLDNPRGVAVGGTSVFVADSANHRVMLWKSEAYQGLIVAGGKGQGTGLHQLDSPQDVEVIMDGLEYKAVFVADSGNNRVVKWVPGDTKGVVVAGGNGKGARNDQLSYPSGVAVANGGDTLYVSDRINNRVMKWENGATAGTVVAGGNGVGRSPRQLTMPYDIVTWKGTTTSTTTRTETTTTTVTVTSTTSTTSTLTTTSSTTSQTGTSLTTTTTSVTTATMSSTTTTTTTSVTTVTTTTGTSTSTTTTASTTTETKTSTTTTTTSTLYPPGLECSSNGECVSGLCKAHCCDASSVGDDSCSICGGGEGSCYAPLTVSSAWDPTIAMSAGWSVKYNKDESRQLAAPPSSFIEDVLGELKGSPDKIRYRLAWGPGEDTVDGGSRGTPPAGLLPAGERLDPGLIDVNIITGSVTAMPRRNGKFTMWLLVEDEAGSASKQGLPNELDQAVVKQWSFEVVGKPDFEVVEYARVRSGLSDPSPGTAAYITRDKVGTVECTVGTTQRIAPVNLATFVSKYASGGANAKIRFTIENPPPGFYIDPSSGEIQGNPDPSSVGKDLASTLVAVDSAGASAALELMHFVTLPQPQFIPKFHGSRTTTGAGYTDPDTGLEYVVGTSYRIATFKLDTELTTVSGGSLKGITYTLSTDAPSSVFVQAKSGTIFAIFDQPGTYNFSVVAVDQVGSTADVEQLSFFVQERPTFELSVSAERTREGPEFADPLCDACSFVVNASYRFAPLALYEVGTTVSTGTFQDITYTVETDDDGWFVSATSGELFGQFSKVGKNTLRLFAVDFGGKRVLLEALTFNVEDPLAFSLVPLADRTKSGPGFTTPEATVFVTGTSYRIAPLKIDGERTSVSVGTLEDITYTLSAPYGWFVSAKNGEMYGQFEDEGNYTLFLYAVDKAGQHQLLEELNVGVQMPPRFTIRLLSERRYSGASSTDYVNFSLPTNIFVVGDSYRISPFLIDEPSTIVSAGSVDDITFTLSTNAPDSFFVQANSGEVFGKFDAAGKYQFELLAVDAAGQTALVETYSFNVEVRPQFVLKLLSERTGNGSQFTDPLKTIVYYVGESYLIAPFAIDLKHTAVSSGTASNISYTLSGEAPDSVFVQAASGEVFGKFEKPGVYAFDLLAVDAGGQTAIAESFSFRAGKRMQFVLGVDSRRHSRDNQYVDMDSSSTVFYVGESYLISPLVLNEQRTVVSAGSFANITFTLSSSAPDSFFVQAISGEVFGKFKSTGMYDFALLAVDAAGQTAEVEMYTFKVSQRPRFVFKADPSGKRASKDSQFTDPTSLESFYVGQSYVFAPLKVDESATTVSSGSVDDITYTLSGDAPDSFFVQATSGNVFGTFEGEGTYRFSLIAVDAGGETSLVERYAFLSKQRSTFTLAVLEERTQTGPDFSVPNNAPFTYYVGESYLIAPLKLDAEQTTVSEGRFGDISYTLSSNAPDSFFVQAKSGVVFGKFEQAGRYDFLLLAVDAGGQAEIMEEYSFAVVERATFYLAIDAESRTNNAPQFTNPTLKSTYYVGTSYLIAPYTVDSTKTTVSAGSFEDITYTLSSGAPNSFFVQASNGQVFGRFDLPGNYSFDVVAVDLGGETFVVEKLAFLATLRSDFQVSAAWDQAMMTQNIFSQYELNVTYEIPGPPLPKDELLAFPAEDDMSQVSFGMRLLDPAENVELMCPGNRCPGKFFVSPAGEMLAKLTAVGSFEAELYAKDSSGAVAVVKRWPFDVIADDSSNLLHGPNGQGCGDGKVVDIVKYNAEFTCDCSATRYEGDNCDAPIESAASTVIVDGGPSDTPLVAGLLTAVFVGGIVIALVVYRRRVHKLQMQAFDFSAEVERLCAAGELEESQEGAERIPREISRKHITMICKIGQGAFGEVWKGVLDESSAGGGGVPGYTVAAKMLAEHARGEHAEEMLREATVMAQVSGHPNLVSLIGVVTSGKPLLLLISYCEHGSLLRALKSKAPADRWLANLPARLQSSVDVATGMAHLADCLFVHRDLAARNVLVDSEHVCKVADFGLARGLAASAGETTTGVESSGADEEYYRSRTGTFPVRWTAPEAMQTMRFSEATDVWSFGVVLVELFTNGMKPYADMANAVVMNLVQGGGRAQQPTNAPDNVYSVMCRCWEADAASRPDFATLVLDLGRLQAAAAVAAAENGQPIESRAPADNGISPSRARAPLLSIGKRKTSASSVTANPTYMIAASHGDAENHQGGVFHVDDGSPVSKRNGSSSGSDSAVGIGIGKASHNIVDNYLMVQEVVSGGDEFDGLMDHLGHPADVLNLEDDDNGAVLDFEF